MERDVLQTLMGALGSVGFAILFQVRGRKLALLFLGGALDWAVYLLCTHNGSGVFFGMLLAAMSAALSSEVFARILRVPVLLLVVPMLIPLVPGSGLYETMRSLIQGDRAGFSHFGSSTILQACAIALGILLAASLVQIVHVAGGLRKKKTGN